MSQRSISISCPPASPKGQASSNAQPASPFRRISGAASPVSSPRAALRSSNRDNPFRSSTGNSLVNGAFDPAYLAQLNSHANDDTDAAYGSMLGACVGDAAGAVLEFNEKNINAQTVERAMNMPGGGVWGVGPGQVTDDSELALSLASGLSKADPRDGFPDEKVAFCYGNWMKSKPFDIGNTTRTAFACAADHGPEKGGLAGRMRRNAQQHSKESQANGALMRITPLAVWGCKLPDAALAEAAGADAMLSHPSPVCQHTNAAYCIAIKHLINRPGDADGAIAAALAWASANAHPDVKAWLTDAAVGTAEGPAANRLIGHVRYGFFYAFRHLKLRTPFREAIRETLLLKGDTDTNACIVGGMMGALHGASGIPREMADPVIQRTTESPGVARPAWLQAERLPTLLAMLFERATGRAVDITKLAR